MLGDGMQRVTRQAALASGDTLLMRLHGPGVLVPTARSVTAVSERRIAVALAGAGAGAGWFAGSDSAFNMFSTVPLGPAKGEYLAWMY
jgi:TRAP-type mannitol/chloroaromatic compound transport system substrate-binding protein